MTAISPLEFVNKKGLFGEHHKKKESNLIQIMELKNLNIIQIFQYKKSNISLDNIKIDNLEMPTENSKVMSNKFTRILFELYASDPPLKITAFPDLKHKLETSDVTLGLLS